MSPKEDLADLLERKAAQIEEDIAEKELQEEKRKARNAQKVAAVETEEEAAMKKARHEKRKKNVEMAAAGGAGLMAGLFLRKRRAPNESPKPTMGQRMHGDVPGDMKILFWIAVSKAT